MALAAHTEYTSDPTQLRDADYILVAVPTSVNDAHIPTSARSSARAGSSAPP